MGVVGGGAEFGMGTLGSGCRIKPPPTDRKWASGWECWVWEALRGDKKAEIQTVKYLLKAMPKALGSRERQRISRFVAGVCGLPVNLVSEELLAKAWQQ